MSRVESIQPPGVSIRSTTKGTFDVLASSSESERYRADDTSMTSSRSITHTGGVACESTPVINPNTEIISVRLDTRPPQFDAFDPYVSSLPKTSFAISPIPAIDPRRLVASSGNMMIFWLSALPMVWSALM